ncbi:MAG TPA: right-handed parallel beta-helix repeat-containing protein [Conexibacter sp.]|nr:right-handed parallel beta-helix repeat-containing protein [Conexibacter sp.]
MIRRRAPLLSATCALLLAALPGTARAADLWVDGDNASCSDARSAAQATSSSTPWCTLAPAAAQAHAGDTVHVLAATYQGTLRPLNSGTTSAPIRFVAAEPGVVLDAAGAANAVKLVGVSDIVLDGFAIRGGTSQGVWIDNAPRAALSDLDVGPNPGAGIQVKATSGLRVERSTLHGNGSAGILELAGTSGARYVSDTITGNGIGGGTYGGDGIQLGGSGALVADSTVVGNGDPGPYEHGIYTAAASSGWTIERNELRDNGGANVKAAGGPGTIRRNRLVNGRYGIVLSDNPSAVTVEHNLIEGRAQHLAFLTQGTTAARARLWANTIVQSGRSTSSGDASAVFVNAAASLELRDNILCYANADTLGVALWVNDAARVGSLASDANWVCGTDARDRPFAWNGSRTTLAGWQAVSGRDLRSLASAPPTFDAALRVSSANLGLSRGDQLGLTEDYAGTPLPASGVLDIGAYEAPG